MDAKTTERMAGLKYLQVNRKPLIVTIQAEGSTSVPEVFRFEVAEIHEGSMIRITLQELPKNEAAS